MSRLRVECVRYAFALGVVVEATIVARCGECRAANLHHLLLVCSWCIIIVKWCINPHTPRNTFGIYTFGTDFATDLYDVILATLSFEPLGNQIYDIALGDGVEVNLQPLIALYYATTFESKFRKTDKLHQRIYIGLCLPIFCGKAIGIDQRFYGNVVARGKCINLCCNLYVSCDMNINRVGFVAIYTTQQRCGVEDRHRGYRFEVYALHLAKNMLLRQRCFGHDVVGSAKHRTIDGAITWSTSAPCQQQSYRYDKPSHFVPYFRSSNASESLTAKRYQS